MPDTEQRRVGRYYMMSRVDVLVAGNKAPFAGAVANISQTGIALYIRQQLTLQAKAMLTLHCILEDGREKPETIAATVVWQRGSTAGLEFEHPIRANTPAAQAAPHVADYIAKMEAAHQSGP